MLGSKAPTDVSILYNFDRRDIFRNLKGQPEGTFVVHQSREKNSISQPYTIYANKISTKDGQVRIAPAYIVYHEASEQWTVGKHPNARWENNGRRHSTLRDLLDRNNKLLKSQLFEIYCNY